MLDITEVVLAPPSGANDEIVLPSGTDDDTEDDVVAIEVTRGEAAIDETMRDDTIDDNSDEEMGITVASLLS